MAKHIVTHKNGGYQVQIWFNSKSHYLGLYKTEAEAIKVRDAFLLKNGKNNTSRTYENHYVDNKIMFVEMLVSKAQGRMTNELLRMFMKIVKGVSRKFTYKQEDDRSDCECYAYEVIVKNWFMFDEYRYDNVFAWGTEIVKRAFALQFKRLMKSRLNTISLDWTNEDGVSIQNYI